MKQDLEASAQEKPFGDGAYAFTKTLHHILFQRSTNWRTSTNVHLAPEKDVQAAETRAVSTLDNAPDMLSQVSDSDYIATCRQTLRDLSVHEPREVAVACRVLSMPPVQVEDLS